MPVFLLSDELIFPPVSLSREDGLLAVGGDLGPDRLLLAYQHGIFPWYAEDEPIMWWSPDPRLVLFPEDLKISKSLGKIINKKKFKITFDEVFPDVIKNCAFNRKMNGEETWLVDDMIEAYIKLHQAGYAHSAEAWFDDELVGGVYGISLGRIFFGESMFTKISNASKVAFTSLVQYLEDNSFDLIDCQVTTGHLINFGAKEMTRNQFLISLNESLKLPDLKGKWDNPDKENIKNL